MQEINPEIEISDILYSDCYLTFLRLTNLHINFDL